MRTKIQIVTLTTIALAAAIGCESQAAKEPGPLERASAKAPVLIATAPQEPKTETIDVEATKPKSDIPHKADAPPSVDTHDEPEAVAPDNEPAPDAESGLEIRRLITAPEVEGREPVAESSIFTSHPGKIYAFLEVSNGSPDPETVTVFFIAPDGKATGGVELDIPADTPRWRTWAFTRFAKEVGLWRVEVRNQSGALLGALPFEVSSGC